MSKYLQSKIYTITRGKDIYIGSTTLSLYHRYLNHSTQPRCSMYQYIHNNCNGDWSEWKINLYEDYPCNNEKELTKREGEIIKKFKSYNKYNVINKYIAGRTNKEWIKDNKEKYDIWMKNYEFDRKEQQKQYKKIRIECDCGCLSTRSDLARHKKTKKHQDLMDNQTSAILSFLECF